jgi:hypothetical protein
VSVHVVGRVSDGGQEMAFRLLRATHERPQIVVGTRVSWPQSATNKSWAFLWVYKLTLQIRHVNEHFRETFEVLSGVVLKSHMF